MRDGSSNSAGLTTKQNKHVLRLLRGGRDTTEREKGLQHKQKIKKMLLKYYLRLFNIY